MKSLAMVYLALAVTIGCAGAMTDKEAWELIKKAKDQNKFPDAEAVIVLNRIETRFKETGASTTEEESLVLIQKDTAARKYSSIHYDFNPRTANVDILEVKAYRQDGETIEQIPESLIGEAPAPAWGMYWNFVRRLAPAPRLGEGDALFYRVQRKGLNLTYLDSGDAGRDYIPPQKDHFFDSVFFEDELPMLRKTYTLYAPRSKPVQYKVVNGEVTSAIEFEPDFFKYVWERENVPAFVEEPDAAPFGESACELVMATLEDWEGKSRWAFEVNEPQFVISEAMRRKVSELTKDAGSDHEKMFNLLHWAAEEVRYLGLDMGEGEGYTVHRTDEIFRDRAGVCKDKAAVLVSMLRAAGFDTYFILTLAMEKAVDVPADQFNHGVVGVKHGDGSWTFLDPTWAPKNRPLFNPLEQEQPILIATPDGEDLRAIPYSPPEDNPWTIKAETWLNLQGPTRTEIHVVGDGYPDGRMRANLAYRLPQERHTYFGIIAADASPYARILTTSHGDPMDFYSQMKMDMALEIDNMLLLADEYAFFIPPLSKHLFSRKYESDYLYTAEPKQRVHDLTVSCTRFYQFEETLHLPKGFRIKDPPERVEMDGPAASLTYEVKDHGKKLVVTENIKIKKRWIPPEEYPQFKQVVDKIQEIRKQRLVLSKEGSK